MENLEENSYSEDNIKTLDWNKHIRLRPGMYIGKLGDGGQADDGIYVLIKEVIDNSVDEYVMGFGKAIAVELDAQSGRISVRDFGRGIPLGKLKEAASVLNTGAKYDNKAFKKSVGLNGVGIKAVNALSSYFRVSSVRQGEKRTIEFGGGEVISDVSQSGVSDKNGTAVDFIPDVEIFGEYKYKSDYIDSMLRNYSYLNTGLTLRFNGESFASKNGLLDLLNENIGDEALYEPIHITGEDIEVAMTHGTGYGESYYSFVNGQHTTQGGTHQAAFREAVVKVVRDFYKKDFDPSDIRSSILAAVSIKVEEPVFESQTKTKLGSKDMAPTGGVSVRGFVLDFLKEKLDNYLHKHPATAEILLKKIQEAEKERKAISGIQKKAREFAKKASLHNRKLRDCRVHLGDKSEHADGSMIFITEGDSASGSITKSRNVNTQAVFSLKGKPLNTYGCTKEIVYKNEEFNLLQAALNIEDGIEGLRYNKIIVATDADVDGMHIRMLLLTFFLQFFPEVVRAGHVHILQTPLFRVRNKKETIYCYSESERDKAIKKLGAQNEITRFKGLGEISPDEFRGFIGESIRLEKVRMTGSDSLHDMLEFYMGKNTMFRQDFIIDNLKVDEAI